MTPEQQLDQAMTILDQLVRWMLATDHIPAQPPDLWPTALRTVLDYQEEKRERI